MTTFLLVRHGQTEAVGKIITGRAPGVHLNDVGVIQARNLALKLEASGIGAIYSSPRERAVETARPVADRLHLPVTTRELLDEVHFGEWEGRCLADLDKLQEWRLFNSFRSATRPPGGEMMLEVQARIVSELAGLREKHPDQNVLIVSHCDVIRAAVTHFAGIPLDFFQRIEISPASVTTVRLGETPLFLRINDTGD